MNQTQHESIQGGSEYEEAVVNHAVNQAEQKRPRSVHVASEQQNSE